MKKTEITTATSRAPIPAESPTPTAAKRNSASAVSFRVVRKRMMATMPARLKASAMLFWMMITMPVTAMGRIRITRATDPS